MNGKEISTIIVVSIMGAIISLLFSTDKPTAALTVFALILSSVSTMISVGTARETRAQTERALLLSENTARKTHEQTERSLRLSEMTLEKAETERKIQDIKDRFNLFYYPLKEYLVAGPALTMWSRESFEKIGFYRYLATEKTSMLFDEFRKVHYSYGRPEQASLLQSVEEDVNSLELKFRDYSETLKDLNQAIEKRNSELRN
jgi:uncharacterized membrane protein